MVRFLLSLPPAAHPASFEPGLPNPANSNTNTQCNLNFRPPTSNFFVQVHPMRYLSHACRKVIWWSSEMKIELGVPYCIWHRCLPESVPATHHLNSSSRLRPCVGEPADRVGVGGQERNRHSWSHSGPWFRAGKWPVSSVSGRDSGSLSGRRRCVWPPRGAVGSHGKHSGRSVSQSQHRLPGSDRLRHKILVGTDAKIFYFT